MVKPTTTKLILLGFFLLIACTYATTTPTKTNMMSTTPMMTTQAAGAPPKITTYANFVITTQANEPWYENSTYIALALVGLNAGLIVVIGPLLVLSYRQGQKNWK